MYLFVLLVFVPWTLAETWSCSGVRITEISAISASNGTITSPNYPRNYPNNVDCQWQITVPSAKKVKLTFLHMNLQYRSGCTADYLELRNGFNYLYSELIGSRYCGSSPPPARYSRHNLMLVRFRTDRNVQRSGFVARFQAVDEGQNTNYRNRGSSSNSSSSGSIGGSVVGTLLFIIFLIFVGCYCRYKRNRPAVIVRETAAPAASTVVVNNTTVNQQQQVPFQHPQAMTNPAYYPAPPPQPAPYPQPPQGYYPPQPQPQPQPYPQPQPPPQGFTHPPQGNTAAAAPPPYSAAPTKQ